MWQCSKWRHPDFAMICAGAFLSCGVLVVVLAASVPAGADPAETAWVRLAGKRAGGGLETEVIEVGRRAGSFERVRLSADGADLLVHEMRVYFADGDMQRLARHVRIARHATSEAFVLEGGARPIERIELTYKGQETLGGAPSVGIWAVPAHAAK